MLNLFNWKLSHRGQDIVLTPHKMLWNADQKIRSGIFAVLRTNPRITRMARILRCDVWILHFQFKMGNVSAWDALSIAIDVQLYIEIIDTYYYKCINTRSISLANAHGWTRIIRSFNDN